MKKTQVINIEVEKDLWREFGVLCVQMDKTKKESVHEALALYIRENSHSNVYTLKKAEKD